MDRIRFEKAFESARLKVYRADRHRHEAEQWFSIFINSDFCRVVDDREGKGQSLSLEIEPVPIEITLAIGDAFHCLSSALDHAMSGLMEAKTGNSTRISFPTNVSRGALRQSFMSPGVDKCGRAKKAPPTRRIVKALPLLALDILSVIKPYQGSGSFLWEIRKADNIDKHNLIIPTLHITEIKGFRASQKVGRGRYNATITGDFTGQKVPMCEWTNVAPDFFEIDEEGQVTGKIAFADTMEVFAGEAVFPTLLNCVHSVTETLDRVEAVASRYL